MLCNEVMEQDVEVIRGSDQVAQAARIMRDAEISFLPVCDPQSDKLVGTLTDRDIAVRLVAEGKPAATMVKEVMSTTPIFCHTDDDVEEARDLMESHQLAQMIVLDENDKVAGVISLFDLAAEDGDEDEEVLEEIKKP